MPLVIDYSSTIVTGNTGFFGSDMAGYPIKLKERENVTTEDYSWYTTGKTTTTTRLLSTESTTLTTNLISG